MGSEVQGSTFRVISLNNQNVPTLNPEPETLNLF
jgi:hypothetical protein